MLWQPPVSACDNICSHRNQIFSVLFKRYMHVTTTEELLQTVIDALDELKAQDLSVIDVRNKTSVTDYMVIASGTSDRHVHGLAKNVVEKLAERKIKPLGVEGEHARDWVLVDLGDVVVHVMLPQTREHYQLEKLWQVDFAEEATSG